MVDDIEYPEPRTASRPPPPGDAPTVAEILDANGKSTPVVSFLDSSTVDSLESREPCGQVVMSPTRRRRRRAAFLLPIALILLGGLGLVLRISVADWRLSEWLRGRAPIPDLVASTPARIDNPIPKIPEAEASVEAVEEDRDFEAEAKAFVVDLAPDADGTDTAEARRVPTPVTIARPPIEMAQADPTDPGAETIADADLDPASFWAALRAEASEIVEGRAEIEGLKVELAERDVAEAAQRRFVRESERLEEAHERRLEFLGVLREILEEESDRLQSAAAIARIAADSHPGDALARDRPVRVRKLALSRNLRLAWVRECRLQGVPEAAILQDLAQAHVLNKGMRRGPADPESALLRAAAEVLAVPTDAEPPRPLPSSRPSPSHRRPLQPLIRPPANASTSPRFGVSRRR